MLEDDVSSTEWVSVGDLFSEESFIGKSARQPSVTVTNAVAGSPETKAAFEKRTAEFDAVKWWEEFQKSLPYQQAQANLLEAKEAKKAKKALLRRWQNADPPEHGQCQDGCETILPHESVNDFLQRMRPSAHAFAPDTCLKLIDPAARRYDSTQNISSLVQTGQSILHAFGRRMDDLRDNFRNEPKMQELRDDLSDTLEHLANQRSVLGGKWSLDVNPADVDQVWAVVTHQTFTGRMGCAAKLTKTHATADNQRYRVAVCTADFTDQDDVMRVLQAITQPPLSQVYVSKEPLKYKCDYYSYLGLRAVDDFDLRDWRYQGKDSPDGVELDKDHIDTARE